MNVLSTRGDVAAVTVAASGALLLRLARHLWKDRP